MLARDFTKLHCSPAANVGREMALEPLPTFQQLRASPIFLRGHLQGKLVLSIYVLAFLADGALLPLGEWEADTRRIQKRQDERERGTKRGVSPAAPSNHGLSSVSLESGCYACVLS